MTQQRSNKLDNTESNRPVLALSELRPTGILWAINRHIFHPRGYALALDWPEGADPDTDAPDGFTIYGDGSEPWAFEPDTDDSGFAAFSKFMKSLTRKGRR